MRPPGNFVGDLSRDLLTWEMQRGFIVAISARGFFLGIYLWIFSPGNLFNTKLVTSYIFGESNNSKKMSGHSSKPVLQSLKKDSISPLQNIFYSILISNQMVHMMHKEMVVQTCFNLLAKQIIEI